MKSATVLLVAGSANFSTRDVWDGYRVALEQAGMHVIPYSTFSFLKLLSIDAVCNDIIGTAVDQANHIDFVVFVDGLYFRGHRSRVPQSIRRAGIPTVLIATDDPYVTIPDAESIYTYRFTNEKECAWEGAEYLPTATLPPPELSRRDQPTYDVAFLGTVFEDRAPLLVEIAEHCERNQRRMLIAGKVLGDATVFDRFQFADVKIKTVDEAEKWQIYSDCHVAINVFRESDRPAVSPSPRIFEVTAFGHAALVSGPRRAEVDSIYGDSIYHFDDADSAIESIERALTEPDTRGIKVQEAKQITLQSQTYFDRADRLSHALLTAGGSPLEIDLIESQTGWIIGCGRTGSTWLAEMLGDLPRIRRWHEPYFGRLFRHLQERPEERDRKSAFFSRQQQSIWLAGLRSMFFDVAKDRFPKLGDHALAVKEVNTPEIYPWIHDVFPRSRLVFLARDPFDVFDSYLDLQRSGSWNDRFGDADGDPLDPEHAERTARHIHRTMTAALNAYESFPDNQRLWLSYENLLDDTAGGLQQCAQILGQAINEKHVLRSVEKHRFENYKRTGRLEFRRQGIAGGWRDSPNFTDAIKQTANQMLGDLRVRLGYAFETDHSVPEPTDA
ncbi:sulfotransferase [Planctomycetes bacterium K23_9]|uniref:Sulfotransferase domain protein n=1 Tax=Stieleria marina TaxID=1930275 RepID=A0A517NZL7_9BACT|nr:Sulfotransferase domain protein [Planctomycetes bacterium K23_9]